MGTAPTPTLWVAGEKPAADKMNTEIKTPLDFLLNRPMASAYQSAALATVSGTFLLIPLDQEDFDTDSMHSTVTSTSRLTCQTPGKYLVVGAVAFGNASTAGSRTVMVRKNSGGTNTGGSLVCQMAGLVQGTLFCVIQSIGFTQMVAGDYVEMLADQNSGGALSLSGGSGQTFLAAEWISK